MESGKLESKEKVEKDQIKSKDRFNNLKADYFLKKVFNNLKTKKLLNIAKYNNNVKKRINININDYKAFSEKYSSIEIEIKAVNNNEDGRFIFQKQDEKYFLYIFIIMKKK